MSNPYRHAVKSELKRSIVSVPFLIAVLAVTAVIFASSWDTLMRQINLGTGFSPGFHKTIIEAAVSSQLFIMACPLFCTIPYAAAFINEYSSGFVKFSLSRISKQRYIKSKIISTICSGGLCLAAAVVLAYFLSTLIFIPLETAGNAENEFLPFINKAITMFLFGAFYAMVGACLSALLLSKYIAYIAPFIIYYLPVIIYERYLPEFYVINPNEWITQTNYWPGNRWGAFLLLAFLIALISLVYYCATEHAFKNI